jgi:hypothetical protein
VNTVVTLHYSKYGATTLTVKNAYSAERSREEIEK